MNNLEGQTFAGYEIVAKLGEGGMGAVYKARQPILNRFVALKTMAAHLGSDKEFVARFQREAASAATLDHSNVVRVHTAGEVDGTHYIVMEFVDGESVRKRLDRDGRIPPAEALAITIYVAQALQYAWNEAKLIHRDIKPDNIFISKKGEVKVGDLGLAKSLATEGTEMTATGMAMGSPHYISPEQATGIKDMDFRTDIYSLGCSLYHMLTGQTPYKGDSSMVVMMKHVHDPAPAIFKAWPQCPMPLGMLVGRMLAKDRNARPKSYEQLIADLFAVSEKLSAISSQPSAVSAQPVVVEKAAAPTMAPATSPDAPTVALQPSVKSKKPAAIYAAAGVAAVVALAGLFLWSPWKAEQGSESRLQAESASTQPAKAGTPNAGASSAAALKQLGSVYKNAVGAEMVAIPPGEFMQGSTKEEQTWATQNGAPADHVKCEGEQPRKTVIKHSVWMGRTEATVGQWKQFVAATGYQTDAEKKGFVDYAPRPGRGWDRADGASWRDPQFGTPPQDNHPVCCVTWNDAVAFCQWLTEQERRAGRLPAGYVVRLPTEAEWEYACRAGTQTRFWWGDSVEDGKGRLNWQGNEDGFDAVSPADHYGERGRNAFGLADMLGNLQEWCLDDFDEKQAHEECFKGNPDARGVRGGQFNRPPGFSRCAYRKNTLGPADTNSAYGFRVCLGPDVLGSAAADSAIRNPQSAIAPDAGWQNAINLLPLIDPQKDAITGEWAVENGGLVGDKETSAHIEIPYQPPEEYDYRVEFTPQNSAPGGCQVLAKGERAFAWTCFGHKGDRFGFSMVNGQVLSSVKGGARVSLSPAEPGRRYVSLVEVRNDCLRGYLDGKLLVMWKTDYKDMSLAPDWQLRTPHVLGLGCKNRTVFHRIEVREVTGKGTFTRGAPASASTGEWTTLPNGWRFGKPVNLGPGVNSDANASNPTVSADGLTLLFCSDQSAGGEGAGDLWMSTRSSPNAPWGPPVNPGPPVNTRDPEMNPCFSADGLTLLFASKRPGGQGELDLWMSSRRNSAGPWGTPENLGPTINSPSGDNSPSLTADGLILLFTSRRSGGTEDDVDIWMSTRAKIGAPWNPPVNLGPPVNGNWKNASPCLSTDGLALFFESDRAGGRGPLNLWMSTRRSKTEPFGEPMPLPINTKYRDRGPALSADDRTLYFSSDRPGGRGWQDLWQVAILPPAAPITSHELRITPNLSAFCAEVAALPAEQQVARVVAKMKELNPEFDAVKAKVAHKIEKGAVTELSFYAIGVTNIVPVAALTSLVKLACSGSTSERSPLEDLSPLRGLPLKVLDCSRNGVADLSPLRGMLLKSFDCSYGGVTDLSPLRGMPLEYVGFYARPIKDLSPLADSPLVEIYCSPPLASRPENVKVLKSIPTLKTITWRPATEFWKQVEAGGAPKP